MRLVAEALGASRGPETIFRNLAFTVAAGESLVVTGPNGIGKSTLLRVVAGLLRPDGGQVVLQGAPQFEMVAEACHYLGHRNGMKRELSVGENLGFWSALMGQQGLGSDRGHILDALDQVGLDATIDLPFGYLSAGQQRRVAMARLLIADRPVWILDEPTAAIDAHSEGLFAGMVDRHLARGGLALMATHQPLAVSRQTQLALDALPVPA